MAKPITQEKILEINLAYYKVKTYSGAAQLCGCAASTVKKYIIPDFVPPEAIEIKKFDQNLLTDFDSTPFRTENWGALCELTDEEYEEIKELWNEIVL